MNNLVFKTIKKLVEDIQVLPYILKVRAISKSGCWIDFQIIHSYETEFDRILPEKVLGDIYDLIFNANWELRDKTDESWYFNHQFVEKFPCIYPGEKLVAEVPIIQGRYWIAPWSGWEQEFSSWIEAYNQASEWIVNDFEGLRTTHHYHYPEHLIDIRD